MLGKLYQEKIHKFGENNAVCEKKKIANLWYKYRWMQIS